MIDFENYKRIYYFTEIFEQRNYNNSLSFIDYGPFNQLNGINLKKGAISLEHITCAISSILFLQPVFVFVHSTIVHVVDHENELVKCTVSD